MICIKYNKTYPCIILWDKFIGRMAFASVHNTRCGHLVLGISKHLTRLNLLIYAGLKYSAARYMDITLLAVRTANMKASVICFMLNMSSRPTSTASPLMSYQNTSLACDENQDLATSPAVFIFNRYILSLQLYLL